MLYWERELVWVCLNYVQRSQLIENRISEILEKEIGGVYKSKEKSKVVGTKPILLCVNFLYDFIHSSTA
ncbi:hypothetical protein Anas_09436 [Armadillidium nasatum]|uniref:Uncharacterized protein n=1 Tax=Armadillidium nasatum TaxID=96803 RepID=A0A5N5SSU4_9CRUS|nr:hypothetical protein Anas_09436 [Armadillidium nasatum]